MRLVAIVLDSTGIEYFHHCKLDNTTLEILANHTYYLNSVCQTISHLYQNQLEMFYFFLPVLLSYN